MYLFPCKSLNLNRIMIASLQECRGYELSLGLFACVGRFDTEVHAFSAIFGLFPCTLYTLVPCWLPHVDSDWHLLILSQCRIDTSFLVSFIGVKSIFLTVSTFPMLPIYHLVAIRLVLLLLYNISLGSRMLKFCAWELCRWQFLCLFCRYLKPQVISYCKLHLAMCHLQPLQSAPDR